MAMSKRERVFKALELDGEPDMVPINSFGMEQMGTSFQAFKNSEEIKKYTSWVQVHGKTLKPKQRKKLKILPKILLPYMPSEKQRRDLNFRPIPIYRKSWKLPLFMKIRQIS